ncbi:Protein MOR1 [Camellia lanceoleosa]|uniref:Protein MOR1 n=1 Tax=Camellia lanceoleosa TaxID=1840588 RepID=A0ACC0FC51_9ERIC|nr:Protein MOR1 [Camellia lanceoleosa]
MSIIWEFNRWSDIFVEKQSSFKVMVSHACEVATSAIFVRIADHNDLMKYFREDLHRRFLSTDFKKQIDGIEMLHKSRYNIEKVREKMRKLIKQIIYAFSAAKTFPYVLEGTESSIICLQIMGQLKSLQLIASLTTERDGEIRKAALNTLATGAPLEEDLEDPMKRPKRIVDVGCGIGGSSRYLARKYEAQCQGITLSPIQDQMAEGLAASQGLANKAGMCRMVARDEHRFRRQIAFYGKLSLLYSLRLLLHELCI